MTTASGQDESSGTEIQPVVIAGDQNLVFPSMDFKAITSNREMAGSFSRYLLAAAARMVPREWSVQDVVDILTFVLDGGQPPVQFIEGRFLRKRLREQISRAERYQESFAIMVLDVEGANGTEIYEGLVDVLSERLRRSDMVFLYKHRVAVILPHTQASSIGTLKERIAKLAGASLGKHKLDFAVETYPGPGFSSPEAVLDWVEDQLR